MIRYEVSKGHYVADSKRLDVAFVFGGEYASVFKGLHECVDVVDFVDLGAREVEDQNLLVVVSVGDIGDFFRVNGNLDDNLTRITLTTTSMTDSYFLCG
jgi:hypothetical protein